MQNPRPVGMPDPTGMQATVVRLTSAPGATLSVTDFSMSTEEVPALTEGEVLFRSIYMSIDAGMRSALPTENGDVRPGGVGVGGRMIAGRVPPLNGYTGGHVGEVLDSRHPEFRPGDIVHGGCYWQDLHVLHGGLLDQIDLDEGQPLTSYLGPLGQNGFVAWVGTTLIGDVRPDDTVVVSGAGGSIGQLAGQLATVRGGRVVGIASGDKCRYVVDELGFDACIDRWNDDVARRLDELCPQGVDVYFDNVGGGIGRAVFDRLAPFGRMVICGLAAEYGRSEEGTLPTRPILRKNLTVRGFVVYDYYDRFDEFREEMLGLVTRGLIRFRQEVVHGLDRAPAALATVLEGRNKGKLIVQIGGDPVIGSGSMR